MKKTMIFLVLKLFLCTSTFAQKDKLYTQEDGISNSTFYQFAQEKTGRLWVTTMVGLNSFDGYHFKSYFNNPKDETTLSSCLTKAVLVDSKQRIWVGTLNGLNRFIPEKNTFTRFPLLKNHPSSFKAVFAMAEDKKGIIWLGTSIGLVAFDPVLNKQTLYTITEEGEKSEAKMINAMVIDKEGAVWMGTENNGLRVYYPDRNKLTLFTKTPQSINSISDNTIYSICQEKNGKIIIGTLSGGIDIYDPVKQTFSKIPFFDDPGNSFTSEVSSIIQDRNGTIWVGTGHNGLKILDLTNHKLLDANHFIDNPKAKDSKVHCFEDKDGNIWFALDHLGIYLKKKYKKPFYTADTYSDGPLSGLSHNHVKTILCDKKEQLWVGTDGGGLNLLEQGKVRFKNFKKDQRLSNSLAGNSITYLYEERDGVWIGTYQGGVSYFNTDTQTFKNHLLDPSHNNPNSNHVVSIFYKDNNLIAITADGGFYTFDKNDLQFHKKSSLDVGNTTFQMPEYIFKSFLDSDKNLWIASDRGVFYINYQKGTVHEYSSENKKIKINIVYDIYEDSDKTIWIGTTQGAYRINRFTNETRGYFVQDGLSNNVVFGIVGDDRKNIWMSTMKGLCKMNKDKETFQKFYTQDGLPSNEFVGGATFKRKDGTLYFGTPVGLFYFHPDSIKLVSSMPNLTFAGVKIFNKWIEPGKAVGGRTILENSIDFEKKINLNYSDNYFTIAFGAIDFTGPERILYAIQLQGVDKNWIVTGQREVTYSNLSPGKYIFKVKSTNSDGVWNNKPQAIVINISPPWWQTSWAYFAYVLLALTALFLIRMTVLYRLRIKNQLYLERMEREKQEEVNLSKSKFFTNVAHELRTPLTLILAPSEKLLRSEIDDENKRAVSVIHKSTQRLLKLTNELLDLEKIEVNQLSIQAQPVELISFLKEIKENFDELAKKKSIQLTLESNVENQEVWLDKDHMDKVMVNLLSNAFKFTPVNGAISILVSLPQEAHSKEIEIIVSDTGKGIKAEHQHKVFERFYQEPQTSSFLQAGTGIGLHLAKTLIELHHGNITVSSRAGQGSSFAVRLPLGNHHFKQEELAQISGQEIFKNQVDGASNPTLSSNYFVPPRAKNHTLLIVEDDLEILNFLQAELQEHYKILVASDGKEGLKIAMEQLPDLVISDVMMAEMDGIELCRKLKSDISTCHIPVILLTARTALEHKLKGLETGADDYIPKPFHLIHLKVRITKLIEQREALKSKFSNPLNFTAKEMTLMSADEKLLQKAMDYVKENMSDPNFNIEDMGKELGMSRVHLYRKIKSLTNQSPSEFVRTIRLKQAAHLLTQNKLNKSEVAYMVGFNSPQYFSTCFQDYFHMSPSEYCQRNKCA